jgi:hypothetical protein
VVLVEVVDSLLDVVQVLLGLLIGVRVVIGQVEFLQFLERKLEMKLKSALDLHPSHVLELPLFIGDQGRPALPLLSTNTDSVQLVELLILHTEGNTLAKLSRIFMFLMIIGTRASQSDRILKWKKVLEDCLVEYRGFMGSREGVRTSLLL